MSSSQAATPSKVWARVEYDGTDFYGFQVQEQGRTVQGEMERALEAITGVETRVTGAGRTDRGVHARGQVVSFEPTWHHELSDLHRALNAVLADDVAVLELGLAPEGFHPRFSAVGRHYRYTLQSQRWRSPLARRKAWQVWPAPNVAQMAEASRCLLGAHDFATFGRAPQGDNTVRTVQRAEFREQGTAITFDIEANAFLYRMVRSIVGMLVLVGWGQVAVEGFEAILNAQDRSLIRQVAPAQGLCLMRIHYATGEGVLQ